MRLEDKYLMLSYDVKFFQWRAREILNQNSWQIAKKNDLTEVCLIMNYIAGIGYDKGDDHYYCGSYAKHILIVAFSDAHVKD